MGLMRVARRAGTELAASVTSVSRTATAAVVGMSPARTPKSMLPTRRSAPSEPTYAGCETDEQRSESLTDDEPLDRLRAGAERHADADFGGPLSDGVRHDAVDAQPGEQEARDSEHDDQPGLKAPLIQGTRHHRIHRAERRNRQLGVEVPEDVTNLRDDAVGVARLHEEGPVADEAQILPMGQVHRFPRIGP